MGLISRVSSRTYRYFKTFSKWLRVPLHSVNDTTKPTPCAEPPADPTTTSRRNDPPRSVNSTGPPKLNDDVLQAPVDPDTSRKSTPGSLTVSDTQKLNK